MDRIKLPRLAYNWVSAAGAFLAVLTFILIAILFAINITAHLENPYLGILIYMFLPPIVLFGLILVPIGMYKQWRIFQKSGEMPTLKWPQVDLNKKRQRNFVIIFIFGTVIFITASTVGMYQAYHFSESVTFCGTTCHVIMEPEHTAYQNSPHARVACTDCHVGSGAGWYTKSKLSGAYQVYATLAKKYPRPIPTPVKNLRPAQETCEQCHWPEKFFGAQQRQYSHFKYDSTNTFWPYKLLIKTGGGDPKTGQASGIHWHMNIDNKTEYIARDEKRQDIPWIRVTNKQTGQVTIYQDIDSPMTAEEIAAATPRVMDCMDCHNRPSHVYNSPDHAIDQALAVNKIDRNLPGIKKLAVELMAREYESRDSATATIRREISDYYSNNYPAIYSGSGQSIDETVEAVIEAYSQNIFPAMKVRWSEYPVNIGHFYNKGCMRCHEGNHQSEDGKTVSRDCHSCHTIISQGIGDLAEVSLSSEGLGFRHPEDISDAWKEMGCYECHTGVQP